MATADVAILRELNVRVTGRPDARRTLVFSHGLGTDQHEFDALLPYFARDYRCVLLDHAGAGHAEPRRFDPSQYRDLLAHARDLVQVLRALNLGQVVLVGHSAGAMIGMLAAIEAPAGCARLVLIGASACYQNQEGYEGGFGQQDLVKLYGLMLRNYPEWVAQFASLATQKDATDPLHVYISHKLARLDPESALVHTRIVLESDYRDWLTLVTQPTLLLQARADPFVPPAAAEFLQRNLPDARLQILEASGHFAFLELPGPVAEAVRAFAPP